MLGNKLKALVHLVPTNKFDTFISKGLAIDKLFFTKDWEVLERHIRNAKAVEQPQHLYFTSDEEIKEGDWYLAKYTAIPLRASANHEKKSKLDRKIVATTNPELWKKKCPIHGYNTVLPRVCNCYDVSVAKIDTPFIEPYIKAYNEGKLITEVWLETKENGVIYPELGADEQLSYILKLKSNGSVIVHPVKERMYSRREVEIILWGGCEQAKINQELNKPFISKEWLDKSYPE